MLWSFNTFQMVLQYIGVKLYSPLCHTDTNNIYVNPIQLYIKNIKLEEKKNLYKQYIFFERYWLVLKGTNANLN